MAILDALTGAGFGCSEIEAVALDDFTAEMGITSLAECIGADFDDAPLPFSRFEIAVHETELSRVRAMTSAALFGCAASDPMPAGFVYAFGPTWLVGPAEAAAGDIAAMRDVGSALGGESAVAECAPLLAWWSLQRQTEEAQDPDYSIDDLAIDDLKTLLGEEDSSSTGEGGDYDAADPGRVCAITSEVDGMATDLGEASRAPDELERVLQRMIQLTDEAVEVAPSEIRPALERTASFYDSAFEIYAGVGFDVDRLDPEALELLANLGATLMIDVAEVASWTAEYCQVSDPSAVEDLAVGDCLLMPENEEIASVESVDCEEPHELEVFALVSLPEGNDAPYPGDLELADSIFEQCLTNFELYVGIAYEESIWFVNPIYPAQESWEEENDREGMCVLLQLGQDDEALTLTGSARGSGQ